MSEPVVRDERGAVMAEAVIVIPFLVLVWCGLDALVQLYAARLRVQVEAGATSMAMAQSGDCGDADVSLGDLTGGGEGASEEESASVVEEIAGCQPFAWAHSEAVVEASLTGLPERIVAGGEAGVRGACSTMCNMKPVEGLTELVLNFVSEALGLGGD